MIYYKTNAILCIIILLMSCTVQSNEQPKIKQGLCGTVTWQEGNMMPSPDDTNRNTGKPIERVIYIYVTTSLKDVVGQAPLFTAINSNLVKAVKTDKDGHYQCELPIGNYSVFIKEANGSLFANNFNGKGEISAVEVKPSKITKLDIVVNYKAAY